VIKLLENLAVDAVVVCGGDGSMAGARCLANESDLKIIGIPATIDNELPVTESALGVDTALNTLTRLAGQFGDAAGGHPGIMVLEVMGRTSGELARLAALALWAAIVITPEEGTLTKDKIAAIAQRLERAMLRGQRWPIVLVAEGFGLDALLLASGDSHPTVRLAQELAAYFRRHGSLIPNLDVRASVPGHLLRAAAPSAADCVLAARFAEAAWKAVISPNEPSGVLGLRHGLMMLHEFDARGDAEQVENAGTFDLLLQDVITV
jgi:6-phosphofructokinase 1